MSYSRNFCSIEANNTRDTLGHAYSNRQAIIQQKLLADPINGIYYVDNEQPTDDVIFQKCYPIGSILTLSIPMHQLPDAVNIIRETPDHIRYLYHGCFFEYIQSNQFGIDVDTLISSGRTKYQDSKYWEDPSSGGTRQVQSYIIGNDLVKPHKLTLPEIPPHYHEYEKNSAAVASLAYGNDYPNFLINYQNTSLLDTTTVPSGPTLGHSHDFEAIATFTNNPPHLAVYMYKRVE